MNTYKACSVIFLIIIAKLSFGQNANSINSEFVKVSKMVDWAVPPFPTKIIEIEDYQICFRTKLPPKEDLNGWFSDLYDKTNQTPVYFQLNKDEFDSIAKFVMTSGILNLDTNYTKPKSKNGIVCVVAGSSNVDYVIETTSDKCSLPVERAVDFEIPKVLQRFDEMFNKIAEKYKVRVVGGEGKLDN